MTSVEKWMTKNPITIDQDASIIEAIHLMKEKGIRRLPVMAKGQFTGLITERMIKDYTPGKATSLDTWEVHYLLSKTPVKDVMNSSPRTIRPEEDLATAAQAILDHKLYGLCVVDAKGELVGIMSVGDMLRAVVEFAKSEK
ncbi:MAG: CBS domain-containing protein [Holophagaceae bacterium]|jgi:acetoin utilization protein AcuB|uniref:CBS domain-containing protein n=1 Tax=Candidatus Geothrix odensensis TaxID=2954440 RepID=A0A936F0N6_9BACT|nr:CBS domain-containing protein [Holophagaceae bacterium]MBK8571703.1 CBS domain-containing protein [Candidatus Geothrix odensensis]MBK8788783.1 CBS domain-containing protein [Holophagaceae bacterium]